MSHKFILLSTIILALIMAAACGPAGPSDATPSSLPDPTDLPPTPEPDFIHGLATVESVEITLLESFPVQANAIVKGNLLDGCTSIDQINQAIDGNRIEISISTIRPADLDCTTALVPFEESISLAVLGLRAGDYIVAVNETTASFRLEVDNAPPEEQPTPILDTAAVSGIIWEDICPADGGSRCRTGADGSPVANGVFDTGETGIEGVLVNLGSGACPSTGLTSVETNPSGAYSFSGLAAGSYCISIDAGSDRNPPLFSEGKWTQPIAAGEAATLNVTLIDGQSLENQDFGWQAQKPDGDGDIACTDSAKFVLDVSVPDDSEFDPDEEFDKTWRLENTGTCTWTTDYQIVFGKGDQMNGPDGINLPQAVEAGKTIDLTVQLTAPSVSGTYRGYWQFENTAGDRFGIGKQADDYFWVQIIVGETPISLDLGDPTWRDPFTNGNNWPLDADDRYEDDQAIFQVVDGNMEITAKTPNWWDSWLITNILAENFYLEITATSGQCDGYDHYGMIFRAPDASEGYLFGISCNGSYSLRYWDGEEMIDLLPWTQNKNIQTGSQKTNKLLVKVEGDQITLYLNEVQIAVIADDTSPEGRFGLFAGAVNTPNFKVSISEIAYWKLEDN